MMLNHLLQHQQCANEYLLLRCWSLTLIDCLCTVLQRTSASGHKANLLLLLLLLLQYSYDGSGGRDGPVKTHHLAKD